MRTTIHTFALGCSVAALLLTGCIGDPIVGGDYDPGGATLTSGGVPDGLGLGDVWQPEEAPTHTAVLGAATDFSAIIAGELAPCGDEATATADLALPYDIAGFTAPLSAGTTVSAAVTASGDLDPFLLLYGPDDGSGDFGMPVALGQKVVGGPTALIEDWPVAESGTYLLVVTSTTGLTFGTATLVVTSSACAVDTDGDGWNDEDDCAPEDAAVHPGVQEVCDGIDNDCDGAFDEGCGNPPCTTDADCDDDNPCTAEQCQNGNCAFPLVAAGTACDDGDFCTSGDYCVSGACTGEPVSCDDANACTLDACDPLLGCVYAVAEETCNDGLDNDCDGLVDEDCTDGDGIPDCEDADTDGDGYADDVDCAPHDASTHPGAVEACDAIDNDCDGEADEDCWCDGVLQCDDGNACTVDLCDVATKTCVFEPVDCDDGDPCTADLCDPTLGCTVVPSGEDTDGDGIPDCEDADVDNDGYPEPEDCDDLDASVNPGATELCDGIDNDCDGVIDEGAPDLDGDGTPGPCVLDEGLLLVLSWDAPGADFDLHLQHPFATGEDLDQDGLVDGWFDFPFDCFESNPNPNWAQLDPSIDDDPLLTVGDGVEAIALPLPEDGSMYRVAIHNVGGSAATPTLDVYIDGLLQASFTGTELQSLDLWETALVHWPAKEVVPHGKLISDVVWPFLP